MGYCVWGWMFSRSFLGSFRSRIQRVGWGAATYLNTQSLFGLTWFSVLMEYTVSVWSSSLQEYAIVTAVSCLSPVKTQSWIPACRSAAMVSGTPSWSRSSIPVAPGKSKDGWELSYGKCTATYFLKALHSQSVFIKYFLCIRLCTQDTYSHELHEDDHCID